MLTEGDIARITRKIAEGYGPILVGVFGSYSIGRAHAGSDLDLLVIKETGEAPHARKRTVERLLFGLLHAVDVPVFTPAEFEDTAYEELSFPWVIARQVRVHHFTPEASHRVPSLTAAIEVCAASGKRS